MNTDNPNTDYTTPDDAPYRGGIMLVAISFDSDTAAERATAAVLDDLETYVPDATPEERQELRDYGERASLDPLVKEAVQHIAALGVEHVARDAETVALDAVQRSTLMGESLGATGIATATLLTNNRAHAQREWGRIDSYVEQFEDILAVSNPEITHRRTK